MGCDRQKIRRAVNILDYQTGRLDDASAVMSAAAQDLRERGMELWVPEQLAREHVFADVDPCEVITGYLSGKPVAAMILTFHDPQFWPNVASNTSSFIHKLAVIPSCQGSGLAGQMVDYAIGVTLSRGIHTTRLDCSADRPKLCAVYEDMGYHKVGERMIGPYPTAFYEKHITL